MTKAPPQTGDFLDFELFGDAPPRQKRPQARHHVTALSIVRRIVATIRKGLT